MNAPSAPVHEFGTGLRSRVERRQGLAERSSSHSGGDLFALFADAPSARPARRLRLVGRGRLAHRGARGAFAA